jgi:hypothetical protein
MNNTKDILNVKTLHIGSFRHSLLTKTEYGNKQNI